MCIGCLLVVVYLRDIVMTSGIFVGMLNFSWIHPFYGPYLFMCISLKNVIYRIKLLLYYIPVNA